MKRVLSLVLVLAMVLSMTTVAFAGTFEDVTDTTTSNAVDALVALGIVEGYEDGTFRPENIVTRAEMAKMMIVALGYESIANDTPAFTDSQNHWAKGYIALASDLGIVNGRGNGIFDPDATVTYQEAAVMMLRTLGYTDQAINNGKSEAYNAGNYKTKALALGLFENLSSLSFNKGANRGDIALMLFNNLTNDMVIVNPLTGLAQAIDPNEDTLISKLATRTNMTVEIADLAKDYTVDLSAYLFETVVAYTVDDDVVFVEKSNDNSVTGTMTVDKTNSTVTVNKVAYKYGTVDKVMVNGEKETLANALTNLKADNNVKVVYDNATDKNVKALVIEQVDKTYKMAKADLYVDGRVDFTTSYHKLPVDKDGKFDATALTIVGVETLADIVENDVVELCLKADGTIYKVYVTRETVEGKITKIDADKKVYINGIAYATTADLALGNEGTFFLDKDGIIVAYTAKTAATVTKNYGVVLGTKDGVTSNDFDAFTINTLPQVKIALTDGTVKTYDVLVKASTTTSGALSTTTPAGFKTVIDEENNAIKLTAEAGSDLTDKDAKLVEFSLNADGQITGIATVELGEQTKAIKVTDAKFEALTNSSTKIVSYNAKDKKFEVLTKAEIGTTEIKFQYVGTTAWSLVVVSTDVTPAAESTYGMIVSVSDVLNADKVAVKEVVALVNGSTKTFLTDSKAELTELEANKLVKLSIDSNNVITAVEAAKEVEGTKTTEAAIAVTNTVITLQREGETKEYVALASDVVVYTVNSEKVAVVSSITAIDRAIALSTEKVHSASVSLFDDNGDGVADVIVLN